MPTDLEPEFGGRIGRSTAESEPWWPARRERETHRPNVLMIIFDDTGWSDFGCFGSEIATPALNSLAASGLRYTNFHVTPMCSPTRACLMTGRNHHSVGMRFLADLDTGFPNSRGRVHPGVEMLPERLRKAGCGTYLVGKWHLTPHHEVTPAGPYQNWPLGRGFDRFYGFLDGCTDQYTPELFEDNHWREPPVRADYHLSADLADQTIRYIAEHAAFRPESPFFLTLGFGATHAPLQAPRSYVEKYVPLFEKGWDAVREERLRRQIELGLVPDETRLAPRNPEVPPWSELSADERRLFVRLQAAFAGFLEHADEQIARILAFLEKAGLRDDTLILALSDNGASREGGRNGAVSVNGPYSGIRPSVPDQIADIDLIGGPEGPAHYPEGWATAGNTPFRRYKQFVDLGGVRSPLIVSWPNGIRARGEIRRQFAHAIDVAATIAEVGGLGEEPETDGRSLAQTFRDPDAPAPRQTQYWEMFGHRAVWHEGWRAVTEHTPGGNYAEDRWRLYDTRSDFSEVDDRAEAEPERLRELQDLWWREAERNSVLPLDDRGLHQLLTATQSPHDLASRRRLDFFAAVSHVPSSTRLTGSTRAMRVVARLLGRRQGESGVIISSGSVQGGYVLHVDENRLIFEHHALGKGIVVTANAELPPGDAEAGFTLHPRPDGSARVWLDIDGRNVGSAELPLTAAHPSFWGIDIARDRVSPVSRRYRYRPSVARDFVDSVSLEFLEDLPIEEKVEALASMD